MENINRLVKNYLSPALRSLGFKKQKHRWKRERGCFVDVIEVVVLQGSTADNERCDLKYGVCVPKFHEIIWGEKQKVFPEETDGVYRSSLRNFVNLYSNDAVAVAGPTICKYIKNDIIPKLDSLNDFQGLLEHLKTSNVMGKSYPLDRIYYALTEIELGDTISGASILNGISQEENKGWSARAGSILETINN